MSEVIDNAVSYATKNADKIIGGLGIGLSVAGAVSDFGAAGEAKSSAKDAEKLGLAQIAAQEKYNEEQRAIQRSTAIKEARVKSALIAAQSGGAGVSGSILTAPMTATNSSLSGVLTYLDYEGELQGEQYDISRNQLKLDTKSAMNDVNARLYKSIFNTGKDTLSFSSLFIGD